LNKRERWQTGLFIYPRSRYYGQVKPENLVFNAQEFAQRVSYICNLETAGKLSPESYQQIRDLWEQLKRSKSNCELAKILSVATRGQKQKGQVTEGRN